MPEGALSGLKVLDVTHHIAGPYCTRLLAALGAEVIKVEPPPDGDPARRMGPFPNDAIDPEKSGVFLSLNMSKKGVTLNLKTKTGVKIFRELVKESDVLVENFEPRVMPSLGLDYATLEKINPGLVMVSISNYGQTGPYRDYKAEEINVVALGGLMYMVGDPDREPLKETGATAQYTAGANACAAALTAVYEQMGSGSGQHVDISIMESVVSLLDMKTMAWSRSRLNVRRNGNCSFAQTWLGGAGGNGIYPCKDGYIGVVFSRADDVNLGAILSEMDEFNDPDIRHIGFGKCVEDEKLNRLIRQAVKDRGKEELYHSAQELRLFWGSVRNIDEVMNNAHYQERKFWVEVDHPRTGPLVYSRLPFIMSQTPVSTGRAPLLGEHNEEVYCQRFGYSREDLAKLRELDVV